MAMSYHQQSDFEGVSGGLRHICWCQEHEVDPASIEYQVDPASIEYQVDPASIEYQTKHWKVKVIGGVMFTVSPIVFQHSRKITVLTQHYPTLYLQVDDGIGCPPLPLSVGVGAFIYVPVPDESPCI